MRLIFPRSLKEPVIFRTTTRINHSDGTGHPRQDQERGLRKGDFAKDPFNYVTVPAISRKLHVKLLENLDKAAERSEQSPYNFVWGRAMGHRLQRRQL